MIATNKKGDELIKSGLTDKNNITYREIINRPHHFTRRLLSIISENKFTMTQNAKDYLDASFVAINNQYEQTL
jgi:hypothetical protein